MTDILSWFVLWWVKGLITGIITTNLIPGIIAYLPAGPLRVGARRIVKRTLIIRIQGFTITIGFGTIIGYLLFTGV